MVVDGNGRFVVLPDCEAAGPAAARLTRAGCRILSHASGRPWLAWHGTRDPLVAEAGPVRLALVGQGAPTAAALADAAGRLARSGRAEQAAALAGRWPGSFHIVASLDGQVWVQGTIAEVRQVFTCRTDGVTLATDRARTAAWLAAAPLDDRVLAASLAPVTPTALLERTVWRGVTAVPGGTAVRLDRDGGESRHRWWRTPVPEVPLDESGEALRDALQQAVAARVEPGTVLAADLSGGFDSTTLCLLADRAGAHLVTNTLEWDGAANEDAHWVARAAAHLPQGTRRLVHRPADLPPMLTGIDTPRPPADEPGLRRNRARHEVLATRLHDHGARTWLTGHGGDHLLQAPPQYLYALARRRPAAAVHLLRGFCARMRWPQAATLRSVLRPPSYRRWLLDQSTALAARAAAPARHDAHGAPPRERLHPWGSGWGEVRLPPWTAPDAVRAVADLLREAAESDLPPLDADPGQHVRLDAARDAGRVARRLEQATPPGGAVKLSPFCDDAVVTACLAARPEDTHTPWTYKPLLAEAMRGTLPEGVLDRSTKDDAMAAWYEGLDHNRGALAETARDSSAAAHGLVDPAAWRQALRHPRMLASTSVGAFEDTLGVDLWLRDLAAAGDHPFAPTRVAEK